MNLFSVFIQLFEYLRLAINEIRTHKFDVLMTVLGIVVGISAVTLILSLGEGVTMLIKNQIAAYQENVFCFSYSPDKKKAANSVSAFKTDSSDEEGGMMGGLMKLIGNMNETQRVTKEAVWPLPFNIPEYKKQLSRCDQVADLTFFTRIKREVKWFEKTKNVNISFCEPGFFRFLKDGIKLGRDFTPFEVEHKIPVALIKLNTKDHAWLLQYGGVIGSYINLNGHVFKIIGALNGSEMEVMIPYVYYPDMANLNDLPQFLIKLKPGEKDKIRIDSFLNWTRTFVLNGDFFQEDSDVGIFNMILTYLPKFTLLMSVVAGISLVVGGIGIMNSMLSSVVQRTREIGIRKSIGAKKHTLIIQFMLETIIITGIGGIAGIALGVLLSTALLTFFKIPAVFPVLSIVYSIVFSIITGVASGLVPAIKAAKLDPIEALGHS